MLRRWPFGLCMIAALLATGCGGEGPAAPAPEAAPRVASLESDEVSASGVRRAKQRWIVADACADGRGMRVRLHDFTDRSEQFPRGYWRLASGATLNRVIECQTGHQICLGAVQDPPPGLEWGVGMRGQRYPCQRPGRCCFRCDTYAHFLELRCEARTSQGLTELEATIEDEAEIPLD
jgi:hypothetical protein